MISVHFKRWVPAFAGMSFLAMLPQQAMAIEPVAMYQFQTTLISSVAGAPALQEVDPAGVANFAVTTVLGNTQYAYNFGGSASPGSNQGGLSLDVSTLLAGKTDFYSVEIVLKFNERDNAWRRILDVANRSTDAGFYVDPGNHLNVFPVVGGSDFANGAWHDVFLVNDHGVVSFYLDNSSATTVTTPVMNIDSNMKLNFFLDNLAGGGQGEWSSGSVALIRVYDEALASIPALPPAVPEPAAGWMLLAGLGALGLHRARRR